ncbi:tripartite tricarboxylate transporter permease [Chelativorans sp. M5D2P16]|uniref:tripartite tricarboxylate transporter permease n=1 Tax=Chelativorans sp. M5D2P16 TaxID=3095678 RepID=UPI002ACA7173|nr:tripartite tricarboxylate transporter permease [Chelativorans sp. M5D2P16]MDZ5696675.1 tripartite tricarboxylate transporter permease [Chelativorans sp. M5D2P16]
MFDLFSNAALGLQVAVTPENLLFCFLGVLLGTLVGTLPGIGALAGVSLLLPVTFYVEPTTALVMLAGIYYGVTYGGSTAAILLNLPGSSAAAVTCLDGYPMGQKGRAGVALFITTIASFVGGTFAIILLMISTPLLARVGLSFGPAEYASLVVLGLIAASTISAGSPVRGIAMVVLGLLIGTVGSDFETGRLRFTFGFLEIAEGISFVAIAMGLFGVAEVINNIGAGARTTTVSKDEYSWRKLYPKREDWRASWGPMARGSVLGAAFGILPGTGASIASFIAYAFEKRWSKNPDRFGKGAIEGVVAPESANNAAAQAGFIPTLSLGIPGDAVMALMLGALIIHGITPGPQVVTNHPELFWGLVMSFWIGNIFLVILHLPLVGVWVRILLVPYKYLYPSMLFFVCIGVYSVNNSPFDVLLVLIFGGLGYAMLKLDLPAAPLLLGVVLSPILENNLRRAMLISGGDPMTFVERPISAGFLVAALVVLILGLRGFRRKNRWNQLSVGAG